MELKNLFVIIGIGIVGIAVGINAEHDDQSTTESSSLFGDLFSFGLELTNKVKDIPLTILDTFNEKDNITYQLYTRENANVSYQLKIGDKDNLRSSKMNPESPTKIIINRLYNNSTQISPASLLDVLRYNYLTTDYTNNVIWINWKSDLTPDNEYPSMKDIKSVGREIGDLIAFMEANQAIFMDRVHILGHGYNAHIAAYVGSYIVKSKKISKIGRITGLDPIDIQNSEDSDGVNYRLDSSDAKFVDVFYTCSELSKNPRKMGHLNVYPNGGVCKDQTGCNSSSVISYCGHFRAIQIMSDSVNHPNLFLAKHCNSWSDFRKDKCSPYDNQFVGEHVIIGTIPGTFYVATHNLY